MTVFCQQAIFEECVLQGCYGVALVRTEVSVELTASIIRVIKICEVGTLALASQHASVAS
jgi:hypothetical protein